MHASGVTDELHTPAGKPFQDLGVTLAANKSRQRRRKELLPLFLRRMQLPAALRKLQLLLGAIGWCASLAAAAPPEVEVTAISPDPPVTLGKQSALYVRIAYTAETSVYFEPFAYRQLGSQRGFTPGAADRALIWLRGARRKWAASPRVLMVPAYGYAILGYLSESNLWPLPVMLASILATLLEGALLAFFLCLTLWQRWRGADATAG